MTQTCNWLRVLATGLAAGLMLLTPSRTLGLTFQVLKSFEALPNTPLAGLLQNPDGSFYGTSSGGGNMGAFGGNGTIYLVTTNGAVTTEYSFVSDEADLRGPLIRGMDGNLYGTYSSGGGVFQFTTNGVLNLLHAFDFVDGATPIGSLIQDTNGYLYGVSFEEADYGVGAIYRVTTSGDFTNLYVFTGGHDGGHPGAGLIQASDGNFYGTTSSGGAGGGGTVFRMTPSGSLKTLYSFSYDTNGGKPWAPLFQATDGELYGTTSAGGYGYGTVFRITTDGTLTTLGNLDNNPAYLAPYPVSQPGLIQGLDGKLYGVGTGGGISYGEFFQVQTNGPPVIFYKWQGFDGKGPMGLIQDPHGNFYGVTAEGGPDHNGTFFQIMTNGTLTNLSSFSSEDGWHPVGSLALGPGGSLYGATSDGGETFYGSWGTVYQWTNDTLVTLHNFNHLDGANPDQGPILGPDGNVYGTTEGDYVFSVGTVYQLVTTNGALNTVLTLPINGANSTPIGLFLGNDDNFYGQEFGGSGNGCEFSLSISGAMETIFTFNGTNGSVQDGLGITCAVGVQTQAGAIYGTTAGGGAYGYGTVFRLNTNGTLTTLYNFDGTKDQGYPTTGVMLASDGNLYGTTSPGFMGYDGTNGTVFRVTTNGEFTNLCAFNGTNGATPLSGLIQGADGNLYGTATTGGAHGLGTIFQVTTNGTLTALFSFDNSTGGGSPGRVLGGLIQAPDGWFYGVTGNGGPTGGGAGALYRFNLASPLEFTGQTLIGNTLSLTWSAVSGGDYQLQATTNLGHPAWSDVNGAIRATSNSVTTSDITIPGAMKFYRVQQVP